MEKPETNVEGANGQINVKVLNDKVEDATLQADQDPKIDKTQKPTVTNQQEQEKTNTTNEGEMQVSGQGNEKQPEMIVMMEKMSPTKQVSQIINAGEAPVEVKPSQTGITLGEAEPKTSLINETVRQDQQGENVKIPETPMTQDNVENKTSLNQTVGAVGDGKPQETEIIPKEVDVKISSLSLHGSGKATQPENSATLQTVPPAVTVNQTGNGPLDIKGSEMRIHEQKGEANITLDDTPNALTVKTKKSDTNVGTNSSLKEQDVGGQRPGAPTEQEGLTEVFKTTSNLTLNSNVGALGIVKQEEQLKQQGNVDKIESKMKLPLAKQESVIQKTPSGQLLTATPTTVDTDKEQKKTLTEENPELDKQSLVGQPAVKVDEKAPQNRNKDDGYLITPTADMGYKVQNSSNGSFRFDKNAQYAKPTDKINSLTKYNPQNQYLTSTSRNNDYKLDPRTRDNYNYQGEMSKATFSGVPDNGGVNIQVAGEGVITIHTAAPTINSPGATTITVEIGPPSSPAPYAGASPTCAYPINQVPAYNPGYPVPYARPTQEIPGVRQYDGTVVPRDFTRPNNYQQGVREGQERFYMQPVQRQGGCGNTAGLSNYPVNYRGSRYNGFPTRGRPGRPGYVGGNAVAPMRQFDPRPGVQDPYSQKPVRDRYSCSPVQRYDTGSRGSPRSNQTRQTLDGRVYPAQGNLWHR